MARFYRERKENRREEKKSGERKLTVDVFSFVNLYALCG